MPEEIVNMVMEIQEILTLLPHRYPFLLIDKVLEVQRGKSLVALKNVTVNEPFFTGHFPEHPVMPGVLILESLAQASGVIILQADPSLSSRDYLFLFVGVDNVRFKRMVIPGDQLHLNVELLRHKQEIFKFQGVATVSGELVCSAELMIARRPKSD
jgi:3-hydroxyacyl-[acyl-carrier-protein] dehydratase